MLIRQRVLIELIRRAERPLTRIELVKRAFVLRMETASGGGSAFYEFLPFKQGPYSFTLKHEIDSLVKQGKLCDEVTGWSAIGKEEIPSAVARDVEGVGLRYHRMDPVEFVKQIYVRHPQFTMLSETERKVERPRADPAIYTAGYEKLQVDAFLNRLLQAGIERLIDVRSNPIARRYGYHKSTLSKLCDQVGIEYHHFPELGIPSRHREGLDVTVDRGDLLNWYERECLATVESSLPGIVELCRAKPSVLVCVEMHACDCHRGRLAKRLAALAKLPIRHLGQLA